MLRHSLLVMMLTGLLLGCSQKVNHTYDTVKLAINGFDDVALTAEKVYQLPYASISVRIADGPLAFMVLAFYEREEAKWVSADSAMLVTQHGRLVKTIGLYGDNLDAVTDLAHDPIATQQLLMGGEMRWRRQVDWSPGNRYGYELTSTFMRQGSETLMVLDQSIATVKYTELVRVESTGETFENQFWLLPESGLVVKSIQYLGPDLAPIEITVLKRYQS